MSDRTPPQPGNQDALDLRFASLAKRLAEDPEGYRREQDEQIIQKYGQAWFDANKRFLDAEWEYLIHLFG